MSKVIISKRETSRDKEEYMRNLGGRLREIRRDKYLSQQDMAARLGLSLMAYSRYERGIRIPDSHVCFTVISEFSVDPHWLLLGKMQTSLNK